MGEAIDRLAKALASGASRRTALGGLFAASAALLPWTATAKNQKKKNKKKKKRKKRQQRKAYQRYLEYCQIWCDFRFSLDEGQIQPCIQAAEKGQGPCYSALEQGPGYFCHKVQSCGKNQYCCPLLQGGDPVTEGACCPNGTVCPIVNGSVIGNLCVV
jgi:hypothetical protein